MFKILSVGQTVYMTKKKKLLILTTLIAVPLLVKKNLDSKGDTKSYLKDAHKKKEALIKTVKEKSNDAVKAVKH